MFKSFYVVVCCTYFSVRQISATWSILAIDKTTGQIGVAINTCITAERFFPQFFENTFAYVPSKGAVVAQGYLSEIEFLETSTSLIANGTTGDEVLQAFAEEDRCYDPSSAFPEIQCSGDDDQDLLLRDLKQIGIVLLSQENATTFTGSELNGLYELFQLPPSEQIGMVGIVGDVQFTVQGNVVEKGTVAATFEGFTVGSSKDLADRLLAALASGAKSGLGDVRCTQDSAYTGKTATVGYLKVVERNGTISADVRATFGNDEKRDVVQMLFDSLNGVEAIGLDP